jgi:hypothetical protein
VSYSYDILAGSGVVKGCEGAGNGSPSVRTGVVSIAW